MMPRRTNLRTGWMFGMGTMEEPPEHFEPVALPHDWVHERTVREDVPMGASQGFFPRDGIGWYRLILPVEIEEGKRYFLDFDGVMEDAAVFVNGKPCGDTSVCGWGYTPFRMECTDFLPRMSEQAEILVRVRADHRPADRWYSGAGLYRSIDLLCLPENYLDERDVTVKTYAESTQAVLTIETGTELEVRATLIWSGNAVAQAQGTGPLALTVPSPHYWSAENPSLYTLTLETTSDRIEIPVGIRTVTVGADGKLCVNGKHTYLRGVCVHQDIACVGIAATRDLWRQRLLLLKSIGVNAIRGAHHVHSREFLELCDRLGFYVYEEFTDKWHSGSYNRYFEKEWKADIAAMIRRDRNHPCILFWGCGNEVENQAQPSMLDTLKELTDCIRRMDSSRPVSYAMNPHFKRQSAIDASKAADIQKLVDEADEYEIEDPDERVQCISRIAEYVDVLSCNYQEQWFDRIHKANPEKPILATEVYQYFLGDERNMQNFHTRDMPVFFGEKHPACLGSFIWAGFDYLGESQGWPNKGSTSAPIRSNGSLRAGAQILRCWWRDEPMVRILIMDYSLPDEMTKEHWSTPPYEEIWDFPWIRKQVVPFMIVTNCERVELAFGEKKLYLERKPEERVIYGFVPYVPGRLTATGFIGDQAVCTHTLVTPGQTAQLVFDMPEGMQEAEDVLLTVHAADAQGHPVKRESRMVRFTASEGACIQGVDNRDMACHMSYHGDSIPLYRGQASVLVHRSSCYAITVCAMTDDGISGICRFG